MSHTTDSLHSVQGRPLTHFIFRGERFDRVGAPVEVLPEFGRYKELLADVARSIWLRDHPKRRNVPKGWYEESFDLRLTQFTEGSTASTLVRPTDSAVIDGYDEPSDYVVQARDEITQEIRHFAEHREIRASFSPRGVLQLVRIAETLQEDETLTIGDPVDEANRATIDADFREQLLLWIDRDAADDIGEVAGRIVRVDGEKRTLTLKSPGQRYPCEYRLESAEAVKAGLHVDGGLRGDTVAILGPVFRRSGRVVRFTDATTVTSLPQSGVNYLERRLVELAELSREERLEGNGEHDVRTLTNARSELLVLARLHPHIGIAATETRAYELEVVQGQTIRTADVDPTGAMYLHFYDATSNTDGDFDGALNWGSLVRFLETGDLPE